MCIVSGLSAPERSAHARVCAVATSSCAELVASLLMLSFGVRVNALGVFLHYFGSWPGGFHSQLTKWWIIVCMVRDEPFPPPSHLVSY